VSLRRVYKLSWTSTPEGKNFLSFLPELKRSLLTTCAPILMLSCVLVLATRQGRPTQSGLARGLSTMPDLVTSHGLSVARKLTANWLSNQTKSRTLTFLAKFVQALLNWGIRVRG
jgi:predicted membrane-bound mannosyltransferase